MTKTLFLISVSGLLAAVALLLLNSQSATIGPDEYYAELGVPIQDYDLFDVGVVDINDDDLLDIFTANHSSRQSLLLNVGEGHFRDVLTAMDLDQDRRFPGSEDSLQEPEIDKPGLYIYRTNKWLHIRAHAVDKVTPVQGTLVFPWPATVREAPATIKISENSDSSGAIFTTVDFSLHGDQELVLVGAEDIVEIPHSVMLNKSVDLSEVYIGMNRIPPDLHQFELMWRDRHGMAWSDYDGDGDIDLFMSRGGIKGRLDAFPFAISDELFKRIGPRYVDHTESSGLRKGNCPSRQVSWVDFDSDGDLDLYISCGRGTDPIFPNQLFRHEDGHQFVDVAAELGLDFASASVFAWVDSDTDNDMDLLSVEDGGFFHYLNDGGEFEKRSIGTDLSPAKTYKLTIADFDNDGDFDAFAVHGIQSILLLNTNGKYSVQVPSSLGLPDRARTANWVDYDNDGLIDLHVVPGGMYRQSPNHTFLKANILDYKGQHAKIVDARSTWFDVDNDGYRDVILAAQTGPDLWQRALRRLAGRTPNLSDRWQSSFFQYAGSTNYHWLQIQLDGPAHNRQAIGARAYVTTSSGTQMQQVGSAEGSQFSQGHYRLYYGTAESTNVSEVRVVWPDGQTQRLQNPAVDQLLHIVYSDDQ
jgi:hypothetical protein